MGVIYPLRLDASLHETIWGGRGLERGNWKRLPAGDGVVGEAWETELSTVVLNGAYAGKTLGMVVEELGVELLGEQAMSVFGRRFPLLAKFIDANAQLSVQVHPDDRYASAHEGGKLGKTEFWYILATEPGASIVHGFRGATTREAVKQAIEEVTLDRLLHEEAVSAGDVIYVPAGTVHAIGSGVLLYELQEYSDVTYRMYDYGRLTAEGKPRELHIKRSLDVAHYAASARIKMQPVALPGEQGYEERCLVACRYFVTRELQLNQRSAIDSRTERSCVILTSVGAEARVSYGEGLAESESLRRGQTIVLPAALGKYSIEGTGPLLRSYVPDVDDEAWRLWCSENEEL
jgi:mannose-6-phosphate isomerase